MSPISALGEVGGVDTEHRGDSGLKSHHKAASGEPTVFLSGSGAKLDIRETDARDVMAACAQCTLLTAPQREGCLSNMHQFFFNLYETPKELHCSTGPILIQSGYICA